MCTPPGPFLPFILLCADSRDCPPLLQGGLATGDTMPDCRAGEGQVGHPQVSSSMMWAAGASLHRDSPTSKAPALASFQQQRFPHAFRPRGTKLAPTCLDPPAPLQTVPSVANGFPLTLQCASCLLSAPRKGHEDVFHLRPVGSLSLSPTRQ